MLTFPPGGLFRLEGITMGRISLGVLLCALSFITLACSVEPLVPRAKEEAIVGGAPGGDPAVVWIYNSDEGGLCSGTVIAPRVILTAKHCVQPPGAAQPSRAASLFAGIGDRAGSGTILRVQKVHTPQGVWREDGPTGLSGALIGEDVAALVLTTPADVTPIDILRESPASLVGQDVTAVGFGEIPSGRSGRKYVASGVVTRVTPNQIFVGSLICEGDSGGPMITADGRVAGVVSWGNGSCGTGIGAYNALDNHLDLIDAALSDAGICVPHGEEVCDFVDNDCDGAVDETCIPLGSACSSNDECSGNLCANTSAGRICTSVCNSRKPDFGCGDGFYCARTEPGACEGVCVPRSGASTLANGHDCARDDECESLYCADLGDGRQRCSHACAAGEGMCLSGAVCVALHGACGGCVAAERVRGLAHGLGEPCAENEECSSHRCVHFGGEQVCATVCGDDGACPNGHHCRTVEGQDVPVCVRGALGVVGESCVDSSDCSEGTYCATQLGTRWCTSVCNVEHPCPSQFTCTQVGEYSVCAPEVGVLGAECASGSDCLSGICSPSNRCTRECDSDAPCSPSFQCLESDGAPMCAPAVPVGEASGAGCSAASRASSLPVIVLFSLLLSSWLRQKKSRSSAGQGGDR